MNRVALIFLIATVGSIPAFAQTPCTDLAHLNLTDGTTITAAPVPANTYKPPLDPYMPPPRLMPAFCRVHGTIRPASDSEIHFELWLPESGWNGQYQQVGNGGLAGSIPLAAMGEPLLRGFAVAATDDGHTGTMADASWAIGHPQKVIDYGTRAVHETAVQAKAILQAFYTKPAAQAYFVGCSDGGREALMEAQRFPTDFLGIVAGAPANAMTHLIFREAQSEQAMLASPASFIPPAKLVVLQNTAVALCDALDGVKDGLISNPQACHFDPAIVACKVGDGPGCLTPPQVEAAKKIYGPVLDTRTGKQISPGFSPGTEAVESNWQIWITGDHPGAAAFGTQIGNAFFANLVFDDPHWDVRTLNFGRDMQRADDKLAAILNSTDPDLRVFKARGGKLIQYHGWGDPAIPPLFSIEYFNRVQTSMGPTSDFYRLFMVPGMSHCGSGAGANVFGNERVVPHPDPQHDVVMALDQWVVHGIAPDQIIATSFVDNDPAKAAVMTRPLCPYPQQATFKGSGDPNSAANFTCRSQNAPSPQRTSR
jgi:feruloyl esterase